MINYNTTANAGMAATTEESCVSHTCVTRCRSSLCTGIVLALLTALLTLTVGLLIGSAFAETIMGAMAAIIVLAVVFAVLILVILIFKICLTARRCRCKKDDCC